jgi:hypothetical protein
MYLRTPLAWTLLGKQFLVVARKPEKQPPAPELPSAPEAG